MRLRAKFPHVGSWLIQSYSSVHLDGAAHTLPCVLQVKSHQPKRVVLHHRTTRRPGTDENAPSHWATRYHDSILPVHPRYFWGGVLYKGHRVDSSSLQSTHLVFCARSNSIIVLIAAMKFIASLTGVLAFTVAALASPVRRDAATVEGDIAKINGAITGLDADAAAFGTDPSTTTATVNISSAPSLYRAHTEQRYSRISLTISLR